VAIDEKQLGESNMPAYPNNYYDLTAECEDCHDVHYAHVRLENTDKREVAHRMMTQLFSHCTCCRGENMSITISNIVLSREENNARG